jgi:hypothetical protein
VRVDMFIDMYEQWRVGNVNIYVHDVIKQMRMPLLLLLQPLKQVPS